MRKTVVVDIDGVKYGAAKKCGSNALTHSGQIVDLPPDILFIRHPIERLASAWVFFHTDFTGNCLHSFIDRVLDGWSDQHWQPQSELWSTWVELVKFERFGEFIKVHTHKSEWKPDITYRLDELKRLYAGDLAMYETAH